MLKRATSLHHQHVVYSLPCSHVKAGRMYRCELHGTRE